MKAPDFDYLRAESLDQALDLLAQHGEDARLLAGGQSLMATLNLRLSAPTVLIDLNHVPNLAGITETETTIRIGAMTRHVAVERSPIIARYLPLIAAAMPHIAHAAIRNRGTIGGSLALADPAAEMPACALALRAVLEIAGPNGRRRVAAADFFRGLFETDLAPDEILVAIEYPKAPGGARWGFQELARRHGDYAMVGLAAMVEGDPTFGAARLAYFAVEDRPVLAHSAASKLVGRALDDAAIAAAEDALDADLDPHGDLHADAATKRHLARVLTGRVLGDLRMV
ncbi:MAG: xanthine dehydrogenase family protein subunit M [Pseudomonadota bacterium]